MHGLYRALDIVSNMHSLHQDFYQKRSQLPKRSFPWLARRDSTITIYTYGHPLQRTIGGPLNNSSVVGGIKDRTVSRANELMRAAIIIHINALMCTGSLVGHKFTAQQMDEDT